MKDFKGLNWPLELVGDLGKMNKVKILKLDCQIEIRLISDIINPDFIEEIYLKDIKLKEDSANNFENKLMQCKKLRILDLSIELFDTYKSLEANKEFSETLFKSLIATSSIQMIVFYGVLLDEETSITLLNFFENSKTIRTIEINYRNDFKYEGSEEDLMNKITKELAQKETKVNCLLKDIHYEENK